MSLFVLASKDGWVNIMYTGLDAVGIDQQVSQWLDSESQPCSTAASGSHRTLK